MSADNRPSIAELQASAARRMETATFDDYDRTGRDLLGVVPVLLEIVAAALALTTAGTCDHVNCVEGCVSGDAWNAFTAALGKVRP